jgi:hypothetical protein
VFYRVGFVRQASGKHPKLKVNILISYNLKTQAKCIWPKWEEKDLHNHKSPPRDEVGFCD